MAKSIKKRRKPDGSVEIVSDCPVCGSRDNYEVNLTSRKQHCWSCGYGGVYKGALVAPGVVVGGQSSVATEQITASIPEYAKLYIERRGFDPAYIIETYDVQWDGSRLCWPTGTGFARRAVTPWDTPKVLTRGVKGLIGVHRLGHGQHVVLVEGDFKAAAIPAPWIGIGIQGTEITEQQVLMLASHTPKVTIMLDRGYEQQAEHVRCSILNRVNLQAKVVPCPAPGPGPDDVLRSALVRALIESTGDSFNE